MFDLHVHSAPDVVARRLADRELVDHYAAAGFTGCVIKAHYESTVGRAAAAGWDAPLQVYGGVALNQHVGGANPAAVVACLEAGGRMIWMPTADAHAQRAAHLPSLCSAHPELPARSYAIPPTDWSVADDVLAICDAVAAADAVLATGHLSGAECAWLVPRARKAGVTRILLTHPSYTVPDMSARETAALCELGAKAEITAYQLLHQPGCDAARLAAFARDVGLANLVLSSDAGQPDSPPPADALSHLIDVLAGQGLDPGALAASAAERPHALVTP